MILVGDFNSVEHITDHFSQRLDNTSTFLNSSLDLYHFSELMGSHRFSFTYHHPIVATHKSRLDRIYLNFPMPRCQGFSQHVLFSDYYMVGTYSLPNKDKGPPLWRMPEGALSSEFVTQNIELILSNFSFHDPINDWESVKVKIQETIQKGTKFRHKQVDQELTSLRMSLRYINRCIFAGEDLEKDRLHIQARIE